MGAAPLSVVVHLGLGSNLGDREAALRGAVRALAGPDVEPLRTSPVYETAYVGPGSPQPAYLNAVAEVRTRLLPLALLRRTQAVERAFGRPPGTHLRPRPLDIDLLFYGDWWIRSPRLVVPHARLAERAFVLRPLFDLGALDRRPELAARLATLAGAQDLRPYPGFAWEGWRGAA
jgi:2-amino-4-hydroxy-6-hydroxymethyldihydropteridine diphosphokinase